MTGTKTLVTSNLPILRSPAATLARRPRDVRDQKLPAKRIVVHITGTGTYINAARRGQPPLDRTEDYFDDAGNPFAHYTVDPWGRVRCHAPENERPWSQGWGGLGGRDKLLADIRDAKRVVPEWWVAAHCDGTPDSPWAAFQRLFPEGTPNDRSVSIEFIQWQKAVGIDHVAAQESQKPISHFIQWASRNYKLTRAQYFMGNLLCRDIALRHGMTFPQPSKEEVHDARTLWGFLGHEDCDPWGRGHPKAGGWDPGALRTAPRFCWYCFLTLDLQGCGCKCVIPTPEMPEWAK